MALVRSWLHSSIGLLRRPSSLSNLPSASVYRTTTSFNLSHPDSHCPSLEEGQEPSLSLSLYLFSLRVILPTRQDTELVIPKSFPSPNSGHASQCSVQTRRLLMVGWSGAAGLTVTDVSHLPSKVVTLSEDLNMRLHNGPIKELCWGVFLISLPLWSWQLRIKTSLAKFFLSSRKLRGFGVCIAPLEN